MRARYLEGTIYIVYGPGPTFPDTHDEIRSCSHSHGATRNHYDNQRSPQEHFWAVFRPNSETLIPTAMSISPSLSLPSLSSSTSNRQAYGLNIPELGSTFFVLRGMPLPWGTYPPDIVEPHGCIPPHLYYRVQVSEYHDRNNSINPRNQPYMHNGNSNNSLPHDLEQISLENKQVQGQVRVQEWTLPFVHRLGDGNDHAGGLTTAYELLQDLEDAEDFGKFIQKRATEVEESYTTEMMSASASSSLSSITPSLYASTELLVSEGRMMQMVDQQLFKGVSGLDEDTLMLPTALNELRGLLDSAHRSSEMPPYWLARSDLKLLLPTQ